MKIYISGPITHEPKADENFKMAHISLSKAHPNAEIKNPILIPYPKYIQDDWGKDRLKFDGVDAFHHLNQICRPSWKVAAQQKEMYHE